MCSGSCGEPGVGSRDVWVRRRGGRYNYLTAFHIDRDHPHLHVVVNRRELLRTRLAEDISAPSPTELRRPAHKDGRDFTSSWHCPASRCEPTSRTWHHRAADHLCPISAP
ncbi:relaxase/mobilization nuclease domain-containing protein [Rhizobium nepotum]|uniref:relaxase/mobilization nuclease domain-containing protein n=1 Tax=Rhizobium nepotum TaxID=1035271 RepID=UPI003CF3AB04